MRTYRTETGEVVRDGERVYNYYDMEPGVIRPPDYPTDDGWFDFVNDRGRRRRLNGDRVCTMAYARQRGFVGADPEEPPMRTEWGPEDVSPTEPEEKRDELTGVWEDNGRGPNRVYLLPGDEVRVYEQRHAYPCAEEEFDPPFPIATITKVNRHPNNPTWVQSFDVTYETGENETISPGKIAAYLYPKGWTP